MYYSRENQCERYVALSEIQACDNEREKEMKMTFCGMDPSCIPKLWRCLHCPTLHTYWDLDLIISLFLFGPQSPLNDELFRTS